MLLGAGDYWSDNFLFLKEWLLAQIEDPIIVWSFVILLSVGLVYFTLGAFLQRRQSSVKSPPGPTCAKIPFSPVLVWHEFRGNRRLYIHSLHERYGDAVRIGYNEYSFASKTAVSTIYMKNNKVELEKSSFYSLFELYGVKTTFSTLGNKEHNEMSKHINEPYTHSKIVTEGALAVIQNRADAFVRKVEDYEEEHGYMDVYEYLHCYALDCASRFLLGGQKGTRSIESPQHKQIMREMSYHDSLKNQLVHFHFPTFLAGYLEQFIPHRPNPLADAYVKIACQPPASESSTPKPPYSLLSHLENREKFPAGNIPAEIMDHLAAGVDTTGDALCFLMYLLSLPQNKSVQDELRKRLKNNDDGVTYMEAVINEGLRCFPPIPMSQPRIVPSEGIIIDGYDIPGKSIVGVQAWSLHRNPKHFEDPDEFRPERWLTANKECKSAFLAFGTGNRRCKGKHLAMEEMKCLLRKIYSELSTSIDSRWTTHVADMQMADQIIASRPKGQKCLLRFKLADTVGSRLLDTVKSKLPSTVEGGVKSRREKVRSEDWRSTSSNTVQKRKTTRTDQ